MTQKSKPQKLHSARARQSARNQNFIFTKRPREAAFFHAIPQSLKDAGNPLKLGLNLNGMESINPYNRDRLATPPKFAFDDADLV